MLKFDTHTHRNQWSVNIGGEEVSVRSQTVTVESKLRCVICRCPDKDIMSY